MKARLCFLCYGENRKTIATALVGGKPVCSVHGAALSQAPAKRVRLTEPQRSRRRRILGSCHSRTFYWKDPERHRERKLAYYYANRERILDAAKKGRAAQWK